MKDSTKIAICALLLSVLGFISVIIENKYADTIMAATWMCIIGGMIIEKLEKPQP